MPNGEKAISEKYHNIMGYMVQTIGAASLLALAVMMGRYAQKVDEIGLDVAQVHAAVMDNSKILEELAKEQALQAQVDEMTDARLTKLETAQNAR